MAKQTLITIKNWFRTGLKPTQQQFLDAWDSFWHHDDTIPASNIENLDTRFDEKADMESFNSHTNDMHAHHLDSKADLDRKNTFSAYNGFEKPLKTIAVLTDTGLSFNLDINGQRIENGFSGKLSFQPQNGNLSLTSENTLQGNGSPVFTSLLGLTPDGNLTAAANIHAKTLALKTTTGFIQELKPSETSPAKVSLAMPPVNGTIARAADLPTPVPGAGIAIKKASSEFEISIISPEDMPIPLTYDALVNLINNKALLPGQTYLITDFQSCMRYAIYDVSPESKKGTLTCGTTTYKGSIEPLIVTALSNDKLKNVARSLINSTDRIIYTIKNIDAGMLASTKGTILRRTDLFRSNTANFDYRQTRYKDTRDEQDISIQALVIGGYCTIDALDESGALMPLVILSMNNSWIKSTSGDFIRSLNHSRIDLGKGRICSGSYYFTNCDLRGEALHLDKNKDYSLSLNLYNLYARVGAVPYPVRDDVAEAMLSNNTTNKILVQGNDQELYLQQNELDGIRNIPLITTEA